MECEECSECGRYRFSPTLHSNNFPCIEFPRHCNPSNAANGRATAESKVAVIRSATKTTCRGTEPVITQNLHENFISADVINFRLRAVMCACACAMWVEICNSVSSLQVIDQRLRIVRATVNHDRKSIDIPVNAQHFYEPQFLLLSCGGKTCRWHTNYQINCRL